MRIIKSKKSTKIEIAPHTEINVGKYLKKNNKMKKEFYVYEHIRKCVNADIPTNKDANFDKLIHIDSYIFL